MSVCLRKKRENIFRRGESKGTKSISHSSALPEKAEIADFWNAPSIC